MPVGREHVQIYLPGLDYNEIHELLTAFKQKYHCTGSVGLDVELVCTYVVVKKKRKVQFLEFIREQGHSPFKEE